MKPLLLPLITLSLLATSATYACEAHNAASNQGAKPTITTKHKAKIHTVVTKKSSSSKAQQTVSQNSKSQISKSENKLSV